jgi:hypothetical protein
VPGFYPEPVMSGNKNGTRVHVRIAFSLRFGASARLCQLAPKAIRGSEGGLAARSIRPG